jgi:hypothetical protein
MNTQPLNWFEIATVAGWAVLLWWTVAWPISVVKLLGATVGACRSCSLATPSGTALRVRCRLAQQVNRPPAGIRHHFIPSVAQLDRALSSGAKGRRFESCQARQFLEKTRTSIPRNIQGRSSIEKVTGRANSRHNIAIPGSGFFGAISNTRDSPDDQLDQSVA